MKDKSIIIKELCSRRDEHIKNMKKAVDNYKTNPSIRDGDAECYHRGASNALISAIKLLRG